MPASKEENSKAVTTKISPNLITGVYSTKHSIYGGGNESDAMGNISVGGEDDHDGRTPNSSTASFVKQIRHALTVKLQIPSDQGHMASERRTTLQHKQLSLTEALVLPSRRIADHLLAVYWAEVHILYPFFLKTELMTSYGKLWTGDLDSVQERRFCALLNMMFALCSRAYKDATRHCTTVGVEDEDGDRDAEASVYFQRAMRLLQLELFDRGSFEQIQALLLAALYLQSTEWPQSCWTVAGLAIRAAQGMDLHLPETSAQTGKQTDREQIRRLWHGCILMDRIVAMTLGRPSAISYADSTAVPIPAPIDDEYLSTYPGQVNHQSSGTPSYVGFYEQSLKLYEIQGMALLVLQHGHAGSANSQRNRQRSFPRDLDDINFGAMIDFDSSLQRWIKSLPGHLTVGPENRAVCCFARQANILHIRQLQVQILLHRPTVAILMKPNLRSKILAASNDSSALPLSLEMAMACASRCIRASQGVVNTIWDEQMKNYEDPLALTLLPAWWFQVFFIYTAATAIIPCYIFGELRGPISHESIMETWRRSLILLDRLSQHSSTARRCMAVLQYVSTASSQMVERGDRNISSRSSIRTHEDLSDQNLDRPIVTTALPGIDFPPFDLASGNEYIDHAVEEFLAGDILDFTWLDSLPAASDLGSFQLF